MIFEITSATYTATATPSSRPSPARAPAPGCGGLRLLRDCPASLAATAVSASPRAACMSRTGSPAGTPAGALSRSPAHMTAQTPKVPSSILASARSLSSSSSRAFWVSASSCSRWNVLAPASAWSSPASPTASPSRSAIADSASLISARARRSRPRAPGAPSSARPRSRASPPGAREERRRQHSWLRPYSASLCAMAASPGQSILNAGSHRRIFRHSGAPQTLFWPRHPTRPARSDPGPGASDIVAVCESVDGDSCRR